MAWAAGGSSAFHGGQFLTNLLVGMGRYRRGEVLSAHRFVNGEAVQHLSTLLSRHVVSNTGALADNIDPTRRFELVYPDLGRELAWLLLQDIPAAAEGLLSIFVREVGAEKIGVPLDAVRVVQAQIGRS